MLAGSTLSIRVLAAREAVVSIKRQAKLLDDNDDVLDDAESTLGSKEKAALSSAFDFMTDAELLRWFALVTEQEVGTCFRAWLPEDAIVTMLAVIKGDQSDDEIRTLHASLDTTDVDLRAVLSQVRRLEAQRHSTTPTTLYAKMEEESDNKDAGACLKPTFGQAAKPVL